VFFIRPTCAFQPNTSKCWRARSKQEIGVIRSLVVQVSIRAEVAEHRASGWVPTGLLASATHAEKSWSKVAAPRPEESRAAEVQ
jgi:hypothetical protein